jgi:uncharacterized protein
MIIDMHSHLAGGFSEKFVREWIERSHFGCMPAWFKDGKAKWSAEDFRKFWADRYCEDLDHWGIEKVVTWGIVMKPYDCNSTIEEVADVAKRHPKTIIPFHCADPTGGKEAVEDLERAVKEFGFKGMKLFPSYNWVYPHDERIFPLYEKCAELKIPAVVHTGFTFNHGAYLKYHHPADLDPVCTKYPELVVIAAHFGFQWVEEAMTLMFKYRNLYADLAWFLLYPLDWVARVFAFAKHFHLIDRIMYGSDYPLTDGRQEGIVRLREVAEYQKRHELVPSLDEDDVAAIMGGNARRVLGF